MPDVAVTEEYRGYTIELQYDQDCPSPRECDNVAVLAQLSSDFVQPDVPGRCKERSCTLTHNPLVDKLLQAWARYDRDAKTVERFARAYLKAVAVDWWDDPRSSSRIVGIIQRAEPPERRYHDAEECLRSELKTFAQWADGDCYGYVITGPDGKQIDDSCWGFIGDEWAWQTAKEAVDSNIAWVHKERAELYRRLANERTV